jgi:hypothetical protein
MPRAAVKRGTELGSGVLSAYTFIGGLRLIDVSYLLTADCTSGRDKS